MKKFLLIITICLPVILQGQVAWMDPTSATTDSVVTIFFDASEGDQGLMGYEDNVYAHTGVITLESTDDNDWKHVVVDWGTANDEVLMDSIGQDLYSISFHIESFYDIEPDETVLKLAFVFRNANGSMSGRNADGSDIFIPLEVSTDWQYQSYTNSNDGLKVHTSGGTIHFRLYNSAIQTEILPEGTSPDNSYAVTATSATSSFAVDTSSEKIHAIYEEWQLIIDKSSLKTTYINNDTLTTLNSFFTGETNQGGLLNFSIKENTRVYGGGSRALPYNLRGYSLEFYNQAHYGYTNHTPNLNLSIPILTTNHQYAWLFDNHHPGSADIGAENTPNISYQAKSGTLRFYLLTNNSYEQLSGSLANLTGHAPLPPLWGLGYIQSRYGYETQNEAEQIVAQMRNADFPMDALVLDLYWFGGTSHMGDFNWDYNNFPEPENMMQNFQNQGIETILITEPYFTLESDLYTEAESLGYFGQNMNNETYVLYGFWAGDAALFDMSSANARNWLWPHYENLLDMGTSGLWTDLGEPESHPADMMHEGGTTDDVHNIYNNLWARMLYNQTQQYDADKRLFNLTRSGYAGMQRYSTYPWSGDIQRSFAGLQAQIPIMLHTSMCGIGYMHSDLGGFTGGGQNPELYTRWLQLGTFSPVMRAHGTGVPSEPIFYNENTQDHVRTAIKMRYRFLPYNYTLAWQYSKNGIPPARPMNYYSTNPSMLDNIDDQYLWGKDLLVAPIINEGATSRMVTLPEGKWANYYNGTIFNGNNTISTDAPIDRIPLFMRQGGFVVESQEQLPHTKNYDSDSIRIRHLLNADNAESERTWYYDDGITAENISNSNFNQILLKGTKMGSESSVTLSMEAQYISSPERYIELMIYGIDNAPEKVKVNQHSIPLLDQNSYNNNRPSAYYEEPFLYVHFLWRDTTATVSIDHDPNGLALHNAISDLEIITNPNPLQSNTQITVWTPHRGHYTISLFKMDGKIIANAPYNWAKGKHKIDIENLGVNIENLSPGIYILRLQSHHSQTQIKVVKD